MFLKTPSPHNVELSALAGCDFASPDMEHAPLGLAELDMMAGFAGRAGLPLLPRLPSHDPATIGHLLDLGTAGILAPHVATPAQAERIVCAARIECGARDVSPSPRAGAYGSLGMLGYLKRQRDEVIVATQIEDRAGLDAVDEIAAVDGIDALFVGPVDLALSLGVEGGAPEIDTALARIAEASKAAELSCGIFAPDGRVAARHAGQGFTWFIVGSDQSHYQARLREELARIEEGVPA